MSTSGGDLATGMNLVGGGGSWSKRTLGAGVGRKQQPKNALFWSVHSSCVLHTMWTNNRRFVEAKVSRFQACHRDTPVWNHPHTPHPPDNALSRPRWICGLFTRQIQTKSSRHCMSRIESFFVFFNPERQKHLLLLSLLYRKEKSPPVNCNST